MNHLHKTIIFGILLFCYSFGISAQNGDNIPVRIAKYKGDKACAISTRLTTD